MSVSGPAAPGGPTGRRPAPRPRPFKPARAAAVIVLAAGVGVAVLSRMGGAHLAASTTSTTAPVVTRSSTTTTATSTTVPPSTTSTLAPAKVTVLVLNGGTVFHAALYFQTRLGAAGYDVRAPANATSETNKLTEVFVVDAAARDNAFAVAQLLKASPSSVMTPTATNDSAVPAGMLDAADLVVVVGADISGQVPPNFETTTTVAGTTPGVTTTTAAPTSG